MTRSSVTLERLVGFNEAVVVNNSQVLFTPHQQWITIGDEDYGSVWLSTYGNDVRYRNSYQADQSLNGPFAANSCGVGLNLGPLKTAATIVRDSVYAGFEVTPTVSSADPEREYGFGVTAPSQYVRPDTITGPYYSSGGATWDATTSTLTVPDGIYHVSVSLQVYNGGQGLVRVRLVDNATGAEIIRATDTLGSGGSLVSPINRSDWGPGAHTFTHLNGSYSLYVLMNTTKEPEGFLAGISFAELTPADPNRVVPAV